MKAWGSIVAAFLVFACGTSWGDEGCELDWRVWQRLPVLDKGRVMPLDTFAFVTVKRICGEPNPRLRVARVQIGDEVPAETRYWLAEFAARQFTAPELLFAWLAGPEKWEHVPFLRADDEQLRRDLLGVPVLDENARRLKFVSPHQVAAAQRFIERVEHLRARGDRELSGLDKKARELSDSYEEYRQITFNPANPSDRRNQLLPKMEAVLRNWRGIERTLTGLRLDDDPAGPADLAQQVGETMQKQAALWAKEGEEPPLEKVEPLLRSLETSLRELAGRVDKLQGHPRLAAAPQEIRDLIQKLADQVRSIAQQLVIAQATIYDNGVSLRLAPGMEPSALEADRYRTEVHPWLNLQTLLYAPDDRFAAYPVSALHEAREAYQDAVKAYRDVQGESRAQDFTDAMDRFAAAVRQLGTEIEPARQKLKIREREEDLIAATAYPPAGSTDTEVFYNQLDPFFWAWCICLAALACLLLAIIRAIRPWVFWLGICLLLTAQGMVIEGLVLRGRITGWLPVSNMFETLVFVAACVAMMGTGGTLLPPRTMYRRLALVIVAAAVSLALLLVAYHVPKFHREIEPLQPVLRSNLWLAVHVKTIVVGYGTAALAWGLGNVVLGYYLFGRYRQSEGAAGVATPSGDSSGPVDSAAPVVTLRPPEACSILGALIYRLLQVTVLLLAAGTILGGWWADKSWGRFWSWDSKEVWALVSILIYVMILHARHVGWSSHFNLTFGAVLGGAAILWTWYGVSFIMSTGKHSYGGSGGSSAGTWAIGAFMAVQLLFLIAGAARYSVETHPLRAK